MRLAGLALALWLAALPASAQVERPETLLDTLRLMREAYLALPGVDVAEIDLADQSVSVSGPDDLAFTSYPDNLHKSLQAAETDAEREALLNTFIANLAASLAKDDANDPATILPVIRSTNFSGDPPPASIPFAGDLRIYYVFNLPTTLRYVQEADAEELGLDQDALGTLAADNFAKLGWSPEITGDWIYILTFDGTFEASFLLDTGLWETIDAQLGQIVMMALARDLIVFTDAEWDGAEDQLRALADKHWDSLSYPLSKDVFIWQDGGWQLR